MEHEIQHKVKSATGNLMALLFTIVGVAFCAGIPLGMAAHQFYATMYRPDIVVQPNEAE